jgi:hypothetical protein
MQQNSNADKQARFRKKEQLRRKADNILRKLQLAPPWKQSLRSLQDIHHHIDAAIQLPFGWTDEDYLNAEKKLEHLYSEILLPDCQLSNDVHESRNAREEFGRSPDPSKFNDQLNKAEENTNALASHIISALKLSICNEADQAAALLEAMRFVGRNLINGREVPCSQATAMCLTTINPMYDRPNWFPKKFANILSQRMIPELLHEIVKNLDNLPVR